MTCREFLLIVAGALTVRWLNVLSIVLADGSFFIEDSPLYYAIVDDWIRLGAYLREAGDGTLYREWERLPLYPALLLVLEKIAGRSDAVVAALQGLMDALACGMVATLMAHYSRMAGWMTGILAILWPNLVIVSSLVVNDTVFVFLLVSAFWLAVQSRLQWGFGWIAAAGLCLGLAVITRPVILYFLPLTVPAVFLLTRDPASARPTVRAGVRAMAFSVCLAVPVLGVLKANHDAHGRWFMTLQGGVHLMGWVLPMTHPDSKGMSIDDGSALWAERLHQDQAERGFHAEEAPVADIMRDRQSFALEQLVKIPPIDLLTVWIEGAVKNFAMPAILLDNRLRALGPDIAEIDPALGPLEKALALLEVAHPVWVLIAVPAALAAAVFSVLQLFGAWLVARRYPVLSLFLLAYLAYLFGLLGPVSNPKYRLPVEPVLIAYSAAAIEFLWRRWRIGGHAR